MRITLLALAATALAYTRIGLTTVTRRYSGTIYNDNDQVDVTCESGEVLVGCDARYGDLRACDGAWPIDDKTCRTQASSFDGACRGFARCASFPSGVSPSHQILEGTADGDDAMVQVSCSSGYQVTGVGSWSGSAVTDGFFHQSNFASVYGQDGASSSKTIVYAICLADIPIRDAVLETSTTAASSGDTADIYCPDGYTFLDGGMLGYARNCIDGWSDGGNTQFRVKTAENVACTGYASCYDFYGCGDSITDTDNEEECDSTDSAVCNSCLYAPPSLTLTGYYNEIVLDWVSPCDGQSSTVCPTPNGYQIEWRLQDTTDATHIEVSSGSTTSTSITASTLEPGTAYEVRIKATSDFDAYSSSSSGLEDKFTSWTSVTTSCDCDGDLDRNGTPYSFSIEQVVDELRFSFAEPNACNEQVTLRRYPSSDSSDVSEIGTVVDTVASCGNTGVQESSLVMFTSELDIGAEYTFEVDVSSSVQSDVTTTTTFVSEFVANLQIVVQAESGVVLSGASVSVYVDSTDYLLATAVIDSASPSIVEGTDVTVTADFSADGITLTMQTPLLTSDTVTLRVEVSQTTSGLAHEFQCASTGSTCTSDTITITHLAAATSLVFVDLAVFTVSGTVVLDGTDGECGTEGVAVCLTDTSVGEETCTATDSDGAYALSAVVGAPVVVTATLDGHTIAVDSSSESSFTLTDNTVIDFLDTTTAELTLTLGGGECLIYLGEWEATALGTNCGHTVSQAVGSATDEVTATVTVPAQLYTVGLSSTPSGLPNGAFVADEIAVDLSAGDGEARFVYNKEVDPATEIFLTQSGPVSASCPDIAIARQGEAINITVEVVAQFDNGECRDLSGTVTFFDRSAADTADCADFGTDAGCSAALVSDGSAALAVFESVPENPQVLESENYMWEQKIEVLLDGFVTPAEYYWSVLVIGHKPEGDAYTMQFPSYIPLLVLHDPPGGSSFSEYTESTTVTTEVAITLSSSTSDQAVAALVLGYDVESQACVGVAATFCSSTYAVTATATGTYDTTSTEVSSETSTSSTSVTTSITFTTSDFAGFTGGEGDMFLVPTLALLFSLTTAVDFDTDTCGGVATTSIAWTVDTSSDANSFTWASAWDIENVIIPELEANIEIETDEVKKSLLQNATDGWAQTLADNEANKANAEALGISFDGTTQSQINFFGGGSSLAYTVGTASSSSTTREVTVELTDTASAEILAEVNLGGVVVGTTSTFTFSVTTGNTTVSTDTTDTSNEWTFTLGDPDPGDEFLVEIKQDPVYGTPVFETLGGSSSCRMEDGTVGRMSFSALIDPSSISNVLSTDVASFELHITNDASEEYQIGIRKVLVSDSSPVVTLVGEDVLQDEPLFVVLPAEQVTTLVLEVEANTVQYSFEDVEIELMPACEWDLWAAAEASDYYKTSAFFSAYFYEPCPAISWGFDTSSYTAIDTCTDGLVADTTEIEMVVFNSELGSYGLYQDNARVVSVELEYTFDALGFWTSALDADGNAVSLIENDSLGVSRGVWDVSTLADGEYLVRAVVVCTDSGLATQDSSYTEDLVVIVDAGAPEVFGTPLPVDQLYWPGDEISITFSETLLCSQYTWSAVVGEATAACYADFGFRDQTTDYLVSNPVPDGFPSTAVSILFWIRAPDEIGTSRSIVPFSYAGPDGPFNQLVMVWKAGNKLTVVVDDTVYALSELAVSAGAWHQLVFTWESATGDSQVFVDGVLEASFVLAQGATIEPGGALVIGQEQDSLEGGFSETETMAGLLDEVSIWVAALTADEVAAYYETPVLTGTERGLFAAYRFADGEQDAGVVVDLHNNMDLTIMGGVEVLCDSANGTAVTESTLALDVACADATITFAFPFGFDVTTIAGQVVTITVDGASDASGNAQAEAASWSFVMDDTATYAVAELVVSGATVATTTSRATAAKARRRQGEVPADFVDAFREQVAAALSIDVARVVVTSAVLDSSRNAVIDFTIAASDDATAPTAADLAPLLSTLIFGPDATPPAGLVPVAGTTPTAVITTSETRPGSEVVTEEEEEEEAADDSSSSNRISVSTVAAAVVFAVIVSFGVGFATSQGVAHRRARRRDVHPAI